MITLALCSYLRLRCEVTGHVYATGADWYGQYLPRIAVRDCEAEWDDGFTLAHRDWSSIDCKFQACMRSAYRAHGRFREANGLCKIDTLRRQKEPRCSQGVRLEQQKVGRYLSVEGTFAGCGHQVVDNCL